jgi:polyene glycosyltransferase
MVTSRKPILLACTQSTGLINSSLAVAGELSRRGVPDLYFASDDNRRAEVEKLGDVEFVSMGPVDPRYAATMWDDDTYRAVTQRSRFKAYRARVRKSMDAGFSREKYLMLDTAVKRIGPALMVINNLCFHAAQLAITRRIPFIVTAPFLPSDLCQDSLPKGYPVPLSGLPLNMS